LNQAELIEEAVMNVYLRKEQEAIQGDSLSKEVKSVVSYAWVRFPSE